MISPEKVTALQHGWLHLLSGYGVAAAEAYQIFDQLEVAYTEPHRHYHTLEHISEMLRIVGRLGSAARDSSALKLAVWFHDVVYDPQKQDNESQSASFATNVLSQLKFDAVAIENINELILSTDHRREPSQNIDAMILHDADLAILGAAEVRYQRYAADIRREYVHVPDADYRAGRCRILRSFLARPRIYLTQVMHEEGDDAARRNLEAELGSLSQVNAD